MPRTPPEAPDRVCAHCGGSMEGKQRIARFCSPACGQKASREAQKKARLEQHCQFCGTFIVDARVSQKFCSRKCSQDDWKRRNPGRLESLQKEWCARNPVRVREMWLRSYAKNKQAKQIQWREWRLRNLKEAQERNRLRMATLSRKRNIARNISATLKLVSHVQSEGES